MNATMPRLAFQSFLTILSLGSMALAGHEPPKDTLGYQDTPLIPGHAWHVHDGLRPQPVMVNSGPSPLISVPAPANAVVLFDGKDLSKWQSGNGAPSTWKIEDGAMVVAGGGNQSTRESFGDGHLHIEFATPSEVKGDGQGRGNSGVFLMGRFEIQVLDSYNNPTYPDGQAGAVYGQYPPLVNASRKPGEWQTYDIDFTAPRFNGDKLETPAYVTVVHNGVLVQNHREILGETVHRQAPAYNSHEPKGPLVLQDHGNPTRFRNIWIVPK